MLKDAANEVTFGELGYSAFVSAVRRPRAGYEVIDGVLPMKRRKGGRFLVEATPPGVKRWADTRGRFKSDKAVTRFETLPFTEDAVCRYANEFGPLGHPEPVTQPNGGSVMLGESLAVWFEETIRYRVLRQLWTWLRDGHPTDLSLCVHWSDDKRSVSVPVPPEMGEMPTPHRLRVARHLSAATGVPVDQLVQWLQPTTWHIADDSGPFKRWAKEPCVGPVWDYLLGEVEERLRGHVHLLGLPAEPQLIRFEADCLLATIYTRFRLEIADSKYRTPGQKVCALHGCTEPVEGRQRYCSDAHREDKRKADKRKSWEKIGPAINERRRSEYQEMKAS